MSDTNESSGSGGSDSSGSGSTGDTSSGSGTAARTSISSEPRVLEKGLPIVKVDVKIPDVKPPKK